jgi:xylulokinase
VAGGGGAAEANVGTAGGGAYDGAATAATGAGGGAAAGAARLALIGHTKGVADEICTPPAVQQVIGPDELWTAQYAARLPRFRALYRALQPHFREMLNV